MGDFEVVDFRIKEEQGKLGAVVTVKEKPWGPDYLRFGLNLATDFSAGSSYNILLEHRKSNMNRLGAEWRNLIEIGATRGLTSTWYQPLDLADRYFVEPSLTWKDTRRDVYIEGDLVGVYSTSYWNVGLKTGMNFGTSSQLRAELNMGQGDAKPDSQNEGIEMPVYDNIDRDTLAAVYEIDTFDNHNMPHQGTRLKAVWQSSLGSLGADYEYDKASLSYTKATHLRGASHAAAGPVRRHHPRRGRPVLRPVPARRPVQALRPRRRAAGRPEHGVGRTALLHESHQEPPRRRRPGDRDRPGTTAAKPSSATCSGAGSSSPASKPSSGPSTSPTASRRVRTAAACASRSARTSDGAFAIGR